MCVLVIVIFLICPIRRSTSDPDLHFVYFAITEISGSHTLNCLAFAHCDILLQRDELWVAQSLVNLYQINGFQCHRIADGALKMLTLKASLHSGSNCTFFHLVLSSPLDQKKLKILQLFFVRVADHRFKLEQKIGTESPCAGSIFFRSGPIPCLFS